MPLEVDLISAILVITATEEVVESDLVKGRGRSVGGDMSTDPGLLAIGADHHGHGIPANDALDPTLDLAVAGEANLLMPGDRIDVGRVGRVRKADPMLCGPMLQRPQ